MQPARVSRRLEGKVAFVSGAGGAKSIGHAVAVRFAAEGAKVGLVDIDESKAAEVADDISRAGGEALALRCDIGSLEECQVAMAAVAQAFGGRIDILLNNAATFRGPSGAYHARPFAEWTTEEWDHILDINLRGMWFCVRAVYPYMRAQGYGKIINVSSSTFWEGFAGLTPYVASKGGVIGLTRSLARALGPDGIRVNCLAPGFTLTPTSTRDTPQSVLDGIRQGQCLPERNGLPEDMAGPAFFLASPDSDFMTGQSLLVNGGLNHN